MPKGRLATNEELERIRSTYKWVAEARASHDANEEALSDKIDDLLSGIETLVGEVIESMAEELLRRRGVVSGRK